MSNSVVLLEQAKQNFIQGNVNQSLTLLKRLLEISRNDNKMQGCAYFEIAKIYAFQKREKTTILRFFNKAVSLCPDLLIDELDSIEKLKKSTPGIVKEISEIQKTMSSKLEVEELPQEDGKKNYSCTVNNDSVIYAGFWKRFCASLLDGMILTVLNVVVWGGMLIIFTLMFTNILFVLQGPFVGGSIALGTIVFVYVSLLIVPCICQWMYFSIMESSSSQATLGKMALGIYVTDMSMNKIGFGKATGRYWLKTLFLSIPLLGIIACCMCGWTEKKQALHDMAVGCLVLSK